MRVEEGIGVIGRPTVKLDAWEKVTGAAQYSGEISFPNMLYGKILRSTHAHALILNIDTSRAQRLAGVKAVVTGRDVRRVKLGVYRFCSDQLLLCAEKVRYIGDEVVAVAAVDEDTAEEALELVRIDYETLPAVCDPEDAMKEDAPRIHDYAERNIVSSPELSFGDVEKGFAKADYVRQDRFETAGQAHCTLQPFTVVARFDNSGRLDIWTPNQSPFTKRRILEKTLGIPLSKVCVRKCHVGGAFGSRSEVISADFCAAILSIKTVRPVKISYSREEEFTTTRQRHPMIIDIRTGTTKDGTIIAKEITLIADTGAYASTGPMAVLNAPLIGALAAYRTPSFKYRGFCVYTNKSICGAMRGHGVPQMRFADGSQMDMIAEYLGIDPVEIRLKNAIQSGEILPYKSRVTSCGLSECMEKASKAMGWQHRKGKGRKPKGSGLGIGVGTSITGFNLGPRSTSGAIVRLEEDGEVTLLTGSVDNGQGNETILAQIVAQELGLAPSEIRVISADTELTPQDQGAFSMATAFVTGTAVQRAAADLRNQIMDLAANAFEGNATDLFTEDKRIHFKGSPDLAITFADVFRAGLEKGVLPVGRGIFRPKLDNLYSKGRHEGQLAAAFTFGAVVVEVEVDPETGKVKVIDSAAAYDVGYALNPLAVEGCIEGSVSMGLGMALEEELIYHKDQLLNPDFLSYCLPVATSMPRIKSIIVETRDENGPYGAKEGSGQPIVSAVPEAVANAVYDAVGVRITSLPITPEKILNVLERKGSE
jgi:4-hydroxybenzoyl-CoA reductase subunit alpha